MFVSDFFLSVRETSEGLWQPVMLSRRIGKPDDGSHLWGAGYHYAARAVAEEAASRWVAHKGAGYHFVERESVSLRLRP
jgi:hypothetical protein